MSDGAHLLIPFAVSPAPGCREAASQLNLPQLERLLARLQLGASDKDNLLSLSPPHERVAASIWGLAAPDGCIPWAAWQMQQEGGGAEGHAWAWITPCHWHVATDHIVMKHPQALRLDAEESQALVAAMQPFFEQDGITLQHNAPTRWLACGELFRDLATASLDRVLGRDIDPWMPRAAAAGPLRRLQQEMQMLLYTHPVNDERLRRGQLPVNSFWASGTGAMPPQAATSGNSLQVADSLRDAALLQDWPAWAAAWQQIDDGQCRQLNRDLERGQTVTLTLCGESNARSWSGAGAGLWRRLRGTFTRTSLDKLFETL